MPGAGWRARLADSRLGRRIAQSVFRPRGAEAGEVYLDQRRVFIVPTRAGFLLAVMLVALLLGSINYSLSLGFALTFLVAGVAWVGMLATFRNLAYLHLRPLRVEPVFAGDAAEFRLVVRATAVDRYAITLAVEGLARGIACDPAMGVEQDVTVPVTTVRRGWRAMPRITLETRFPLGLWRAWAYWTPAIAALVYPRPAEAGVPMPLLPGDGREQATQRVRGSEDFAGLRGYVPGDPVRHIAWRAMARNPEGRTMTKLFDGGASGEAWFTLDAALAQVGQREAALSLVARWVLDADREGVLYGLDLGTTRVPPGRGPGQRAACLEALALAPA